MNKSKLICDAIDLGIEIGRATRVATEPIPAGYRKQEPGDVLVNGTPVDVAALHNSHAALLAACEDLLNAYIELVNSGDAGSWNPEEDSEVVRARAAIAQAKGGA